MTAGSGPAGPSLRASLRLFRLAMSAQRQRAAAASTSAAALIAQRPLLQAAGAAAAAAGSTSSSGAWRTAAARPTLVAPWRRAGGGGGLATSLLLPAAAAVAAAAAAAPSSLPAAPRAYATAAAASASASVRLNDLHPGLGATKAVRRVGRGDGSGRGKTCGRGTKGQGARKGNGKPGLLFDGGTRQLRKYPKVHARPGSPVEYDYVNVSDVAAAARAGLLGGIDFSSSSSSSSAAAAGRADAAAAAAASASASLPLVTMKHLRDAGLVSKTVRWGVKLLARRPDPAADDAADAPLPPMRLQVSAASAAARRAVERAGGALESVYYNRLGLRALLKVREGERGREREGGGWCTFVRPAQLTRPQPPQKKPRAKKTTPTKHRPSPRRGSARAGRCRAACARGRRATRGASTRSGRCRRGRLTGVPRPRRPPCEGPFATNVSTRMHRQAIEKDLSLFSSPRLWRFLLPPSLATATAAPAPAAARRRLNSWPLHVPVLFHLFSFVFSQSKKIQRTTMAALKVSDLAPSARFEARARERELVPAIRALTLSPVVLPHARRAPRSHATPLRRPSTSLDHPSL
jgi:large subunit ribosomal protein L15